MLQPGDVLVVDLYGKKEGGTIVGDNLFYYIMRATKSGGLVVDGSMRDLEGIMEMDMPAYYQNRASERHQRRFGGGHQRPDSHRQRHRHARRCGDRRSRGCLLRSAAIIEGIVDRADTTHVHDEWTRKKFDEGKYKSTDIYGSPRDPALMKEYQEYLKKRLEEIRKNNPK